MSTQTLHFSIDGGFMTEHCRNLVTEGRWDHAMRTLLEGLEGMPADIAFDILRGDSKLVGVNDLALEDDDATDHKAAMDYMFGGTFSDSHGRFLRPYAVVTSWGKMDLVDEKTLNLTIGSKLSETKRGPFRNPLVYADDPYRDIALDINALDQDVFTNGDRKLEAGDFVLCRQINNYPHLLHKANRSIEAAIIDLFDSKRRLRETGYSYFAEEPEIVRKDDVEEIRADYTKQEVGKFFKRRDNAENARSSLDEYKRMIIEQAGDDFMELVLEGYYDGSTETIRVPTAPFEHWALQGTRGSHLAKPWKPVCPPGMKMVGDNPYHTDWMVGGDLGLDFYADDMLMSAAINKKWEIQAELLKFECVVLAGSGKTAGRVVHPKRNERVPEGSIAVIPNAGPDYLEAAISANAIITENGGMLAHLVSIAREHGFMIVRVENARKLYTEGMELTVDADNGRITVEAD